MRQLINTACFPPRRVFWQQPRDSLKAGQGSLSKVPLSPNNVTNSVLTWMLLQAVPETGKITQLIKLSVRKPSAKCRDTLPHQPWVCSPWGAGPCSGGEAAATCQRPGLGSAASGGRRGRITRAPAELHQPPTWVSRGAHRFPPGESRAARAAFCTRVPSHLWLLGRGAVRALVCAVPGRAGHSQARADRGTQPRYRGGRPTESPRVGACFLILPCLWAFLYK